MNTSRIFLCCLLLFFSSLLTAQNNSAQLSGEVAAILPDFGLPAGTSSELIFAKDGRSLVGWNYNSLTIWDLASRRVRHLIREKDLNEMERIICTDDPKTIHIFFKQQFSSQNPLNNTYWSVDVQTGKISRTPKDPKKGILPNQLTNTSQDLAKSPDFLDKNFAERDKHLVVSSPQGSFVALSYKDSLELWNQQTQQLIYKRGISNIHDLTFDALGKQLALSTSSGVLVMEVNTGEVTAEFEAHQGNLDAYDPLILESGDVVFKAGAFQDQDKYLVSVFNLPNAKQKHSYIYGVHTLFSNGGGFYSTFFNGSQNVINDDTGNIFYTQSGNQDMWTRLSKNKKYLVMIERKGNNLVIWDNQLQQAKHRINGSTPYIHARFDERDSLFIAHNSREIEVYALGSGKKILSIPLKKEVNSNFTFHFSANSRYLAYINTDIKISVWDLKTQQETVLPIKVGRIIGVSDVSNKIAVFEMDNQVSLYQIKDGVRLFSIDLDLGYDKKNGRYFPEIEKIVVATQEAKIHVLDARKGVKLMTIYPSSNNEWFALAEDGIHFETSKNGLHQVDYRTASGEIKTFTKIDTTYYKAGMVQSVFKGLPLKQVVRTFPSSTWTPAQATLNYLKWFWELSTPIVLAPETNAQSPSLPFVKYGDFHFLGEERLLGEGDGTAQILEAGSLRTLVTLKTIPVESKISKDQRYWVFTQNDRQICVWDFPTLHSIKTLSLEDVLISSLAISPDSRYVLAGCTDGKIRRYSLPDLKEEPAWNIGKFNISKLVYSNKGSQILVIDEANRARLYTFDSAQPRLQYSIQLPARINHCQFNADDTFLMLYSSQKGHCWVYDLKTRKLVFQQALNFGMYIKNAAYFDSKDPNILYCQEVFKLFKLNLKTGEPLDSLDNVYRIFDYHPSKKQLLLRESSDEKVLFNLDSWQKTNFQSPSITNQRIFFLGDDLKKIYYYDHYDSGVYREYDWTKNEITASLDSKVYEQKIPSSPSKYAVILKKDSVQIFDNETKQVIKNLLWPRTMPKRMNISKLGRYLAYPLESSNNTELFDLQQNKVIHTLPFAASSYFFSSQDQYLFVINPADKQVQIVEIATLQHKGSIPRGFDDGAQIIPSSAYNNIKVLFYPGHSAYQFINLKTGQSLGIFYFLLSAKNKPGWGFIAKDGRFDGSPEVLQQFYYSDEKKMRTLSVDYKNNPKYQPGLLQKLLE